jgi:hypothetical protein
MADFSVIKMQANTGTQGSPTWTDLNGANHEVRWSDVSTQDNVASASWPFTTRPASGTAGIDYAYAFTADATGTGVLGNAGPPTAFDNNNYKQFRWNWDGVGTFASAPIFTAYPSTAHGSITRGDGSLLGGHASDTGGTARSYMKGTMFGRVDSAGAPAAAPGSAPVVTDGATGAVSPTAGANWSAWQSMQGDNDWLAFPSTPAATAADTLSVMMRMFTGANETPGTFTPSLSLKYTYA